MASKATVLPLDDPPISFILLYLLVYFNWSENRKTLVTINIIYGLPAKKY